MENSKTNYFGNGKQIGNKIQVSLNWKRLLKVVKSVFKEEKYLIIDILPLKETSKYGNTHTVVEHIHTPKEDK